MIETKKLLVQKTVDNIVKQIDQQKNLIFADLDSKEKSLTSKLNQNPKIWNCESLNFNLKTNYQDFSSAVSLDVTLTQVSS